MKEKVYKSSKKSMLCKKQFFFFGKCARNKFSTVVDGLFYWRCHQFCFQNKGTVSLNLKTNWHHTSKKDSEDLNSTK